MVHTHTLRQKTHSQKQDRALTVDNPHEVSSSLISCRERDLFADSLGFTLVRQEVVDFPGVCPFEAASPYAS